MNYTSHTRFNADPSRTENGPASVQIDGGKTTFPRDRAIGVRAALATWIVGIFLAWNLALAQSRVDVGCTHGDLKCTADFLLVCQCYEGWMESGGGEELLTFCVWEDTEEYCGEAPDPVRPPPCTRDYLGATFEFPDEVKVCKCYENYGCAWETDY